MDSKDSMDIHQFHGTHGFHVILGIHAYHGIHGFHAIHEINGFHGYSRIFIDPKDIHGILISTIRKYLQMEVTFESAFQLVFWDI